jgi:hypothetical protein
MFSHFTRLILLLALALSLIPSSAMADPFAFGMYSSMTLVPGLDTQILGNLINTGAKDIDFGCARASCGGLDFGASIAAGPGEGLNALQIGRTDPTGSFFYSQFPDVVIHPGEGFTFIFATLNFDPTITVGNPFGTVLHPTFGFRIGSAHAEVPTVITTGPETAFGPIKFVEASMPPAPVPEPSAAALLGSGLIGLLLVSAIGRGDSRAAEERG